MGSGTSNLESIRAALIAAAVCPNNATDDWACFIGSMPDGSPAPSAAICLYETPGEPPLEAWKIDYPSFQVMGRSVDQSGYSALRDKMQAVFYALHAQEAAVSDQIVFLYAKQSAPLPMGQDAGKRIRMAWNFRMMRNRPA